MSRFVVLFCSGQRPLRDLHSFPTRRSSDLSLRLRDMASHFSEGTKPSAWVVRVYSTTLTSKNPLASSTALSRRSEEHTSELQSQFHLVCRLLLEKKKNPPNPHSHNSTQTTH